jgi:hypothetical protein
LDNPISLLGNKQMVQVAKYAKWVRYKTAICMNHAEEGNLSAFPLVAEQKEEEL